MAFGGRGKDRISVADGDTCDEVSCGEEVASVEGDDDVVADTVTIDVVRSSYPSGPITDVDTVYEQRRGR
jgi:hypothetical protein